MGSSNFELKLHYAMKVQKIIYKIFIFTIIFLVYNAKKNNHSYYACSKYI